MSVNLLDTLTPSEKRIYDLMIQELTGEQIAQELTIAHGTVKFHKGNIYRKLGVRSAAGAAAYVKGQHTVLEGAKAAEKENGEGYTATEVRRAAKHLVDLGLVDAKLVNGLVTDLLLVLEGKL